MVPERPPHCGDYVAIQRTNIVNGDSGFAAKAEANVRRLEKCGLLWLT